MDNIDKQLNKLPRPKMSLAKKVSLKYSLYVLIIQDNFSFDFLLNRKFQHRAISFILLLSLLLGLPMYSYASPRVNEQHILFPVKKALENVELKVAKTEIKKQEKYEKFSERRLDEAEVLSKNIKTEEDRTSLSHTIEEALILKNKAREVFPGQGKSEEAHLRQKEKLNNIASFVGIEESEELVEDIAVAMDEIKEHLPKNNNRKNEIMRDAGSTGLNYGQQKKEENNAISEVEDKEKLLKLREAVEALKIDLGDDKYDETDVEVLFERLDKRIETVNEAIESEAPKNINGIINSTKAITNNAKHFIKKKDSGVDSSNQSQSRGKSGK